MRCGLNNHTMKTKTITLYDYSELSKEAKEKARAKWNETNDDPFMQSHMINLLKEKLEERGIKYDTDSMDVRYSLSYSQGDGFMFEGTLYPNGKRVTIKHADAHYYHSRTASFNYDTEEAQGNLGDFSETMTEKEQDAFEEEYRAICTEMEQAGYDEIEYQQSEEVFEEQCDGNEWTFREDGTLENV